MADASGLQIPEGFNVIPDPNDQMYGTPSTSLAVPEGFTPQNRYTGSFLPFSVDAQGGLNFDPNAGIVGQAWRAIRSPYDVVTGAASTPYTLPSGGDYSQFQNKPNPAALPNDPGLLARANTAAQLMSPVPAATRAGELAGGASRTMVPTARQLQNAADQGFAAARRNSGTVPGGMMDTFVSGLDNALRMQSAIPENAPETFKAIGGWGGKDADFTMLDAYRGQLDNISAGDVPKDARAANIVRDYLDQLIDHISPEASEARANLAAAKRSNNLTGALDTATTGMMEKAEAQAAAAHSGLNLDNNLRQQIKMFLQNPDNVRGYSPAEIAALERIRDGLGINTLRWGANLLGGGGGAVGTGAAGVIGAGIGHALFGPEGGEIGMFAGPAVGRSLKAGENALARSRFENVDELVRSRSPLAQQWNTQGRAVPATGWDQMMKNVAGPTATGGGVPLRDPTAPAMQYSWPVMPMPPEAGGFTPGYPPRSSYPPIPAPPALPIPNYPAGLLDQMA